MTRARSKSIVQKIALDVATHDDDQFDSEFAPTIKKRVERKRSNSTSSIMSPKKETSGERIAVFDGYPLTLKETSRIWSHHLSSYNHDIIISDEAIDTIQALTNDSILGFQTKCNINLTSVSALIDQSNDVITLLNDLTFKYDYVSEETSDFAKKSQQLIDKKTQLEEISYEISNNLEMFESLDSITKILTNTPGINIVKKQSFHQTLFKLDNCLNFINLHPKYREAETYNVRFRQCMTRSLTLIRNYLIEDLKDLQGDISGKLVKSLKSNGSSGFSFDLFLYTSFNDHLNPLDSNNYYYNFSNLCFEIYKRIGGHQEYIGLYNDVTTQYFKIRSSLLNDYIWNQIDTLLEEKESEELNLVQFIQNNISFFKKMLYKELELFQRYFIQQQDKEDVGTLQGSTKWIGSSVYSELIEWFKSLLEPLYDTLRNKIIREINIGVLCEITTLLQKYYEFEDNSMNSTYNLQNGIINFGELFEPILQDVQARLIFRIQLYVDEKLLNYKAKPEDLHVGHRRASAIGITNDKNTTSGNAALVSPDSLDYEFEDNLFKEWFPPIGKALTILSNIYQLINSIVFDDMAHYIVHSCIFILKGSAYKLAVLHLGEIDAKLYLLKNMILLQQQLNNFDIQYVRTETTLDFTSGIFEIIQNASARNGSVTDMIKKSVPKVVSNMIDAKFEIESELSNSVSEFIETSISKINISIEKTAESQDAADLLKRSLEFRDKISQELPKLYGEMQAYIDDVSIIDYLVDTIFNRLISQYEEFYNQINISEGANEVLLEIMEVDTLYGFLSEIVNDLHEPQSTVQT